MKQSGENGQKPLFWRQMGYRDALQLHVITERQLIENRIQRELEDGSLLCAFHRLEFGVRWNRSSTHCKHPDHPPIGRGKRGCSTRLAPLSMVTRLNNQTKFSFPFGGRICRKHRLLKPIPEDAEVDFDDSLNATNLLDESYRPDEIIVEENVQARSLEACNQLTTVLGISPINWQVVRTPAADLGESSKRVFRKKLFQVQEAAKKLIAEGIAPT